jgi:hypothetical protein
MKKFRRGVKEVIAGVIGGILFSAILSFFKANGLIPSNFVILFTIAGAVGTIITIFSFRTAGIVFTLGWILGAWLLKGIMSPDNFLIYFWSPVAVLAIRTVVFFMKFISGKK